MMSFKVLLAGDLRPEHPQVVPDHGHDLAGTPVPAGIRVSSRGALPRRTEQPRDTRLHGVQVRSAMLPPPVEREPAAGTPMRLGNRTQDRRDRPPARRARLTVVVPGQLPGDPVGGHLFPRPVHHQVKYELRAIGQGGVERLRQWAITISPFPAGMAFAPRMLIPRWIAIKHHSSAFRIDLFALQEPRPAAHSGIPGDTSRCARPAVALTAGSLRLPAASDISREVAKGRASAYEQSKSSSDPARPIAVDRQP
jgi:hypothetical protein